MLSCPDLVARPAADVRVALYVSLSLPAKFEVAQQRISGLRRPQGVTAATHRQTAAVPDFPDRLSCRFRPFLHDRICRRQLRTPQLAAHQDLFSHFGSWSSAP